MRYSPARSFRLKLAQSRKIKPSVCLAFSLLTPTRTAPKIANRSRRKRNQIALFAFAFKRNLCLVYFDR